MENMKDVDVRKNFRSDEISTWCIEASFNRMTRT